MKNFTIQDVETYTHLIKENNTEQILKNIKEAINTIEKPKILYYAVSKMIEKGNIIHMNETSLNPEYIVINEEDFEENKEEISKLSFLLHINKFDYFKYIIDRQNL